MAPMTRRAQANAGVAKKVHRKQKAPPAQTRREQSDSWELLERGEGDFVRGNIARGGDDDPEDFVDGLTGTGRVNYRANRDNPDTAVEPLRDMADRIGSEVETFAQSLDQVLMGEPEDLAPSDTLDAMVSMVQDFRRLVEESVQELSKSHERERLQELRKEWSAQTRLSSTSTALERGTSFKPSLAGEKSAEHVNQLRQLQQEADLWDLFHIMLELRPFESEQLTERKERAEKLNKLGPPHRYTTEDELWERFELENEQIVEKRKIKEWLERTADHQYSDVGGIVEELESKAGRGKGLWTAGWMYTREKIKGEKRLRDWPDDADAHPPKIRRTNDNDLLTTRLDPDAPLRQQRTLEKQDAYFEKAMWIACWEMLRRGKSWQEVSDWCEERKEGSRAILLGTATDMAEPATSRAAWRHLCRLASQSGCSSEHETAVFGLMGGNMKVVEKVCRTIDDHLYAFYSATLLRQFDQYVLDVCPDKAIPNAWRRSLENAPLQNREQAEQAIQKHLMRLRDLSSTKAEFLQPMKVIQSFILSDEVGSLLNTIGLAVAETARLQKSSGDLFAHPETATVAGNALIGPTEVLLTPQTLRIAAHMSIVYRILAPEYVMGEELMVDDNIVVAYIQALRAAGKRDLIPMYAARLQRRRATQVLARVLQDIVDGDEQVHMIKLLQQYHLDVVEILQEHLDWTLEASFKVHPDIEVFRVLESTNDTKLYPGQQIIEGFLKNDITEADEGLIRALQWFQLLPGHWTTTFKALTEALLRCFILGNIPCARYIIQTFPYDTISLRKTFETIHRSINLMEETTSTPYDEQEKRTWDLMKRRSRTYYELEQLVHALEALDDWRSEEYKFVHAAQKPPTPPNVLKRAKQKVSETMEPILKGVLLHPHDEQEADDMLLLRQLYITELILAYNSVLHTAGNLITRDALLEAMDLSVAIAAEEPRGAGDEEGAGGNGLREAFVEAERVRDLVQALAYTSRAMLVLKAEGKPWRAKKGGEGRALGVWEVVRGEEEGEG